MVEGLFYDIIERALVVSQVGWEAQARLFECGYGCDAIVLQVNIRWKISEAGIP